MPNLFNTPYREVERPKEKVLGILAFGLFIFLFLFLFKPFGLSQIIPLKLLLITLGFGLVTIFVLFIFKYLLDPVFVTGNMTFGKSILWDILVASCIGSANYFYVIVIFSQEFLLKYLLYYIWTAILVGIIPVTIGYIVAFNRMYKTALEKAAIVPADVLWESEIVIKAGNPKNEFKCNPKSIIYLCSNDNYVTVVAIKEGSPCKTTVRGTLKAAESELGRNSRFLRCHKCYIINLDYVSFVRGHSQNMIIRLTSPAIEIPVSRSKAGLVLKKTRGI